MSWPTAKRWAGRSELDDGAVRRLLERHAIDPDRITRCVKRACG